jgi:hypothetical protein
LEPAAPFSEEDEPSKLVIMGLEKFNPFKKDSPTFPSVVIPLAQAPAHSLSELLHEGLRGSGELSPWSQQHHSLRKMSRPNSGWTPCRAEVESDISTSTNDSAYDRMFLPDFRTGPRVATPVPAHADILQSSVDHP